MYYYFLVNWTMYYNFHKNNALHRQTIESHGWWHLGKSMIIGSLETKSLARTCLDTFDFITLEICKFLKTLVIIFSKTKDKNKASLRTVLDLLWPVASQKYRVKVVYNFFKIKNRKKINNAPGLVIPRIILGEYIYFYFSN